MTTKKDEGTHFPTLEAATKEMLAMDFNRVLEYRLTYHQADNNGAEYWTVKRRIMIRLGYNAFGQAKWTEL